MSYIIKNNKCIARTINIDLISGTKIKYVASDVNLKSAKDFDDNVQYAKISNAKKWDKHCNKNITDAVLLPVASRCRRYNLSVQMGHLASGEILHEFVIDTKRND